jgi:hypothetical protein
MAYVDLNTIHNPTTGTAAPATWGDGVRDNFEFLVDPPACSVYSSVAQAVGNNSISALGANAENFDNDSMHSNSVNPSRITINTAGRYHLFAVVRFDSNGTGQRMFRFIKNGTTDYIVAQIPAVTGVNHVMSGSRTLVLAAADYVQVECRQTSGGALDVTLDEFAATWFTR